MPTKNLVLLGNQRNGLHMLMGYAVANGYIEGYEPFGPKFGIHGMAHVTSVIKGRNPAPTCYVLHQDQIRRHLKRDITIEELNDFFNDADYIYVKRDFIDACVSYFFAMNDKVWHSRTPVAGYNEVAYDYGLIERYVIRFAMHQWNPELVSSLNAQQTSYEEICSNPDQELGRLFSTINVPLVSSTQSIFYKQYNPLKEQFVTAFKAELPIKNPDLHSFLIANGLIL